MQNHILKRFWEIPLLLCAFGSFLALCCKALSPIFSTFRHSILPVFAVLFLSLSVYAQDDSLVKELVTENSNQLNDISSDEPIEFPEHKKKERIIQYQRALSQSLKVRDKNAEAAKRYAQQVFESAKRNNIREYQAKGLIALGRVSKSEKNFRSAQQYFQYAFTIAGQLEDDELVIDSLLNISEIQRLLSRYSEAKNSISKAKDIATKNNDTYALYRCEKVFGNVYRSQGKHEEALESYKNALELAEKLDFEKELVAAHKNVAKAYASVEDYESSILHNSHILELYEKRPKTKESDIVSLLDTLSENQRKLGDFLSALKYSQRSLSIKKRLSGDNNIEKTLLNLSIIYRKLSSYDDALKYANELLIVAKNSVNTSNVITANNQLGLIYDRIRQPDKAENFFKAVIDIFQNMKVKKGGYNRTQLAAAYRGLASLNYKAEEYDIALDFSRKSLNIYREEESFSGLESVHRLIGSIYYVQNNFTLAEESFRTALSQAKKVSSRWSEARNYFHLGVILGEQGNIEKAKNKINEGLFIAEAIKAKSLLSDGYQAYMLIAIMESDYKTAYDFLSLQYRLFSEISDEEVNNRIAELGVLRELDSQERKIDLLERKSRIDSLELERQNNELVILNNDKTIADLRLEKETFIRRFFLVFLVLLLLALAFGLFLFSRIRYSEKIRDLSSRRVFSAMKCDDKILVLSRFRDKCFTALLMVGKKGLNKSDVMLGVQRDKIISEDSSFQNLVDFYISYYKNIAIEKKPKNLKEICKFAIEIIEDIGKESSVSSVLDFEENIEVCVDEGTSVAFLVHIISTMMYSMEECQCVYFSVKLDLNTVELNIRLQIKVQDTKNIPGFYDDSNLELFIKELEKDGVGDVSDILSNKCGVELKAFEGEGGSLSCRVVFERCFKS